MWNIYIVVHVAITIIYLRLLGSNTASIANAASVAGIIISTLGSVGMILDNRENAFMVETAR